MHRRRNPRSVVEVDTRPIPQRSRVIREVVSAGISRHQVHRLTKGERFRPPLTPPQYSTNPWNPVTVKMKMGLAANATVKTSTDIITSLIGQVGLGSAKVELRIQSIMAWSDGASIQLWPLDHIGGGTYELTVCDSMAQKNMYATAGYHYPAAHASKVYSSADAKGTPIYSILGEGKAEVHVKTFFRGAEPKYTTVGFIQIPIPRPCSEASYEVLEEELKEAVAEEKLECQLHEADDRVITLVREFNNLKTKHDFENTNLVHVLDALKHIDFNQSRKVFVPELKARFAEIQQIIEHFQNSLEEEGEPVSGV